MAGNITRRGRSSWRLKFDQERDPLTGKRKTAYVTFRGTKRQAEVELARLITSVQQGTFVAPDRMTVGEYLDRWESDWVALHVSPKTGERYIELLRRHVRPRIGALPLQRVRPTTLAELYATLQRTGRQAQGRATTPAESAPTAHQRGQSAKLGKPVLAQTTGLAPRTVGHVHRVVHRALGHAVQWGLIVHNPAASVSPPPVASAEVEILKSKQVREVLDALRGRPLYYFAAVAIATGMRRGELLALRWDDIDLDGGRIRVERSLEQTKAGLRFKAPKTRNGRRSIALPRSTVADLRVLRTDQRKQRLALGLGKMPVDHLIFGNWDGTPRSPNAVSKEWARAVSDLNLPRVTLHALRHTHASQLIASGLDILTISRRLGHGSPTVTLNVYGHMFANTDDRAADVMEAALTTGRTE